MRKYLELWNGQSFRADYLLARLSTHLCLSFMGRTLFVLLGGECMHLKIYLQR